MVEHQYLLIMTGSYILLYICNNIEMLFFTVVEPFYKTLWEQIFLAPFCCNEEIFLLKRG